MATSGEFTLGVLGATAGLWLLDSAIKGRAPLQTLKLIVESPGNTRSILKDQNGQGYLATYSPPGAVTGTPVPTPEGVPGAVAGDNAGSAAGQAALAYAMTQIGKPYVWGATGPNSYDCSGLVYASYLHGAGVKLGRTTAQQIFDGVKVKKADLGLGDLVFPDPGHVQLYAGNGLIVEAPHTGLRVREVGMWGFLTARRID